LGRILESSERARFAVGYLLKDATARRNLELEDKAIPRIVCSEAFV